MHLDQYVTAILHSDHANDLRARAAARPGNALFFQRCSELDEHSVSEHGDEHVTYHVLESDIAYVIRYDDGDVVTRTVGVDIADHLAALATEYGDRMRVGIDASGVVWTIDGLDVRHCLRTLATHHDITAEAMLDLVDQALLHAERAVALDATVN